MPHDFDTMPTACLHCLFALLLARDACCPLACVRACIRVLCCFYRFTGVLGLAAKAGAARLTPQVVLSPCCTNVFAFQVPHATRCWSRADADTLLQHFVVLSNVRPTTCQSPRSCYPRGIGALRTTMGALCTCKQPWRPSLLS